MANFFYFLKDRKLENAYQLFQKSFGRYRREIIILIVLGFLSGLLEGIGVNAIIPLFSFVTGESAAGLDFISQAIEKFFAFSHITYSLPYLLGFICVLFVFKAAAMVAFNFINIQITANYEKVTRSDLFRHTLRGSWPYLLKQRVGYLEQVLTTDINRGAALLRHLSGTILLATNLLMYALIALNISVLITLATIVIGAVIFLILKPLFYRARILSDGQANVLKEVAHLINEHVVGMKTIKAAGVEPQVVEKADGHFESLKQSAVKLSLLDSFNNVILQPIGIIFIVTVFALSYKLPEFSFASFAVIIYLVQKMFSYLQIGQGRLQTINELIPYLQSSVKYRDTAIDNLESEPGDRPFAFTNELSFHNVSFAYLADKPVLRDVSFAIKRGEMVGIIGPSGAGKTTLVDLFLRLLTPSSGEILLDSQPITQIGLANWRSRIGYVSQDMFLLNDTIANNITFYNQTIPPEDVTRATDSANIGELIRQLPQGLNTIVGERGIELSGGQRQRIILARALARKPEILVLDEATSALDSESEAQIQEAIEKLKGEVTTLVIAHRLTTVLRCDSLIILEDGAVTETGSPEHLLKNKASYFAKVYNLREH